MHHRPKYKLAKAKPFRGNQGNCLHDFEVRQKYLSSQQAITTKETLINLSDINVSAHQKVQLK